MAAIPHMVGNKFCELCTVPVRQRGVIKSFLVALAPERFACARAALVIALSSL